MIDLTPGAATKVLDLMSEKKLAGYGLRVFVTGGGCGGLECGMGFDRTRDGDVVTTLHGVQVMVDPFSAEYLDGARIDFVEEEGGFRVENIAPVAGCNCGSGERRGGCCAG